MNRPSQQQLGFLLLLLSSRQTATLLCRDEHFVVGYVEVLSSILGQRSSCFNCSYFQYAGHHGQHLIDDFVRLIAYKASIAQIFSPLKFLSLHLTTALGQAIPGFFPPVSA